MLTSAVFGTLSQNTSIFRSPWVVCRVMDIVLIKLDSVQEKYEYLSTKLIVNVQHHMHGPQEGR